MREWEEGYNLHPAGKAFGNLGQCENICRARQKKAAGTAISIYRMLDCSQKVRCALYFINNGSVKTTDKPSWVTPGSVECRVIIQRNVGPLSVYELPDQRGFATLARTNDHDNRSIPECDRHLLGRKAREIY